jgi:hypothetical protein
MTLEQLCCICIGFMVQAATFALGLMVGVSLRRKDFKHDNCNAASRNWHTTFRS